MDFDHYNFYEPVKAFQHRQYIEELVQDKKVNKGKIKKSMMELVYLQLVGRLDSEFPAMPSIF